jgi:hypothetical protein
MRESTKLLIEALELTLKGHLEEAQHRLDDYELVKYSEPMSAGKMYMLDRRAKIIQEMIDDETSMERPDRQRFQQS